jgi:ATP-binding cassette subfamily F protein 3
LDGLTNRIWDIENKNLKIHHYTVQEYLRRKSDAFTQAQQVGKKTKKEVAPLKKEEVKEELSYEEKKEQKRKVNKLKNGISQSEKDIEKFEKEIKEMDKIVADLDYTDEDKTAKTLEKYENLKKSLEDAMSKWEEYTLELDEIGEE